MAVLRKNGVVKAQLQKNVVRDGLGGALVPGNDPLRVERKSSDVESSRMTLSDLANAFNEIVQEEKAKSFHCIGRIRHDKTRMQMELAVQLEQLKEKGSGSETLLSDIEEKKAAIENYDACIALIKNRSSVLERELRVLSPSVTVEKKVIVQKAPSVSNNHNGLWYQTAEKNAPLDTKKNESGPSLRK